jgi:hypothetical protein
MEAKPRYRHERPLPPAATKAITVRLRPEELSALQRFVIDNDTTVKAVLHQALTSILPKGK